MAAPPLAAKLFDRAVRCFHDHLAKQGKLLVSDSSGHASAVLVRLHRAALTLPPQDAGNRRLADSEEPGDLGVGPNSATVCFDQPPTEIR